MKHLHAVWWVWTFSLYIYILLVLLYLMINLYSFLSRLWCGRRGKTDLCRLPKFEPEIGCVERIPGDTSNDTLQLHQLGQILPQWHINYLQASYWCSNAAVLPDWSSWKYVAFIGDWPIYNTEWAPVVNAGLRCSIMWACYKEQIKPFGSAWAAQGFISHYRL